MDQPRNESTSSNPIMRPWVEVACLVVLLGAAACSSGSGPGAGVPDVSPPAAAPEASPSPPGASGSTNRALVPATQADRGRDAFLASCTACHASGEFTASAFRRRWSTRDAADLYRLMSNTMPEDAPSSLAPERYVEIVTYILSMNGFDSSASAGPWDVATLDGISLAPLAGS